MAASSAPTASRSSAGSSSSDAPAVSAAGASGGLTSAEAARRLRQDGPNAVGREGHRGPLAILVSQFASPLVLILLAASLVSFAVDDQVEAAIILTIVLMSAALGFVQEARSAAAVEALQARLALKATVIRDGKQQDLPIVGLVSRRSHRPRGRRHRPGRRPDPGVESPLHRRVLSHGRVRRLAQDREGRRSGSGP